MAEQRDTCDQVADLRQRAVQALTDYRGGFAGLRRVNQDLKAIIFTLDELLDSPWTRMLIAQGGRPEIPYAMALSEQQTSLGPRDEQDIKHAVADLLAEFRRYEIPLKPDERPREYDIVRLRKPLPAQPGVWPWGADHVIAAGTTVAVWTTSRPRHGEICPPNT
jgi:hypothetical protein